MTNLRLIPFNSVYNLPDCELLQLTYLSLYILESVYFNSSLKKVSIIVG